MTSRLCFRRNNRNSFINVDLPTLGFPTIFTNPALCIILFYSVTSQYLLNTKVVKIFYPTKQPTIAFVRKQEKTHLFRQKMRLSYISTNLFCVVSPNEIKSSPCKSCSKSREDKFISFFEFMLKFGHTQRDRRCTRIPVLLNIDQ